MTWTVPDELVAQVQRLWDQGRLLSCAVPYGVSEHAAGNALEFPLPLRLRRPSPRELGERYEAVRAWIEELESGSRARQRLGYEIVHPLTTEPWGIRRFFVRVPGGTVLNIAQHHDPTE